VTNKRNFLFTTFEAGGSVMPALTVVDKLVRRGHRVRVMSDACNRRESEAAGAAFVPWGRAPSKPLRDRAFDTFDDWSAPNPAAGFMNLVDAVLVGPALAFARDVIDEIAREHVDLVVSSEMLFGVLAGCEAVGQKHALLSANIALFPLPGVPPLGPGLPPAGTDQERALHAAMTADTLALLDRALPTLNAARSDLGLPPLAHLVDQHDSAEALLLATSRAFDFAPDILPHRVRYVGPQLGEPAWAAPWVSPFAPDDRRPLVLVSFSTTFQNHAGVVQRVVDALADLPVKAVVTLGGSLRRDEVRPSGNVVAVESAPHHEVMREAALVITHGGHGTVMKALSHHRPLLIIPHGRDQNDNAVRVTERGAGLALPRDADVATLRTAIRRLLAEPAFAAAARALGTGVAREATESPVIEVLERLAARPPGRSTACQCLALAV
jgi:MGT family glycosyltransferase